MRSVDPTATGIRLNEPSASYINFTKPHFKVHGSIDYNNTANQVLLVYVNICVTKILTMSTTGISVIETST